MAERAPEERLAFWLEVLGVTSSFLGVTIGIFIVAGAVGGEDDFSWLRVGIGSMLALFSAGLYVMSEALRRILLRVFDAE